MLDENTFGFWQDKTVVDSDGEKIGTIADLYLDDATDQREWLIVDTGFFGRNAVVPAGNVLHLDDRTVQVPFSKQQVKDSPHIEADGELSEQDERVLYEYYDIPFSDKASPSLLYDEGAGSPVSGDAGSPVPGEHGIHRLRGRDGTEPDQQTIPGQQGEIVAEREPIGGEDRDIDAEREDPEHRAA
jgi:sporulation protein YlmC with PRC-barrel domain